MNHPWLVYLLGALLSTMASLIGFMLKAPPGSSLWRNILEYYFGGEEPVITSILTFGGVWLVGSIYCDRMEIPGTGAITSLPMTNVVSFCLGAFGEWSVPHIIKFVLRRIEKFISGD
jgi:hypothetical protein